MTIYTFLISCYCNTTNDIILEGNYLNITIKTPPGIPDSVNVSCGDSDYSYITIELDDPNSPEMGIIRYEITIDNNIYEVDQGIEDYTFEGLEPNTNYTITVRVFNPSGSNTSNVTCKTEIGGIFKLV